MSDPEVPEPSEPGRPGGAHRRADGRGRLPVLLLSLFAIAVAAAVVVVVLRDRGEPAHTAASPKATHTSVPSVSRSTKPTSSAVGSPSTPVSSGNPTPAGASPTMTTSVSPRASVIGPPSVTAAAAPAVDVLNDSTVSGLAARAASRLREGGWKVSLVGNYDGANVPTTTIFYADSAKGAAQRLAAQYGITRVLAAAGSGESGLSASDLTLVVARDWKDAG